MSKNTTSVAIPIKCACHGEQISAVVCRHHIRHEDAQGFIELCSDPDDLQAWCYACEDMFEKEDGMTERFRAFNDMAIVCTVCYITLKKLHTKLAV